MKSLGLKIPKLHPRRPKYAPAKKHTGQVGSGSKCCSVKESIPRVVMDLRLNDDWSLTQLASLRA